MRKKLLIIALPTLMALSGCANVSVKPAAQQNAPIEAMAEDNLAHEELFGAAEEGFAFKKTSPYKLDALTADFVKVGYQIKFSENGAGTADDTISIRFVAAIKDENVNAYWSRGLAQPNGYVGARPDPDGHPDLWSFKLDDGTVHQSNVVYHKLTDDGDPITAGSGAYTGYTGFVIYTLRNIPYESYKDSYLAAYVSIIDKSNGENNIKSQAIAVKIERNGAGTASKHSFTFDPTVTGHFLQGTIGGAENTLLRATEHDAGDNSASYYDVSFKAADCFGSFYYSPACFQFFGHDDFFAEESTAAHFGESAALADYVKPDADILCSLLVSRGSGKENHVYTVQDGAAQTFTVNNLPDWLGNDGAILFASVERTNHAWHWVPVSFAGTTGTFSAPNNIETFLLVRCVAGTTQPNWDLTSGDDSGRIYNKTGDISTTGVYSYDASGWGNYPAS